MARSKNYIETTRASRDGHEFHESWAARKSLQLVLPKDKFIGIAIEGLDPGDQKSAPKETVQIADLTLYYGKDTTFEKANEVHVLQLKYSIGRESIPFRFSDAEKTIKKFAKTFEGFKNKYGIKAVSSKLRFEIVTNRPILPELERALNCLGAGTIPDKAIKKQAAQFKTACKFKGKELSDFARSITLTGLVGNLSTNKTQLQRALASWSAGSDPVSRAWLGQMCKLLREKAGLAGQGRNVIRKVDVLDALGVYEDDLFPCPEAFPSVGSIVEREQLSDAIKILQTANSPYLIHALAGTGKTVFLQSIAAEMSKEHEVFVFDCFGGGAYRSPEDARHQPSRGLIHIVNNFARRGLCDPIIPSAASSENLVKTFRNRLSQAVETLRNAFLQKKIFLFVDAADNAADFANERGEPCFPKLLLQSFMLGNPIPGFHLVLSCRTDRRKLVKEDLDCLEIELKPFSLPETEKFLKARIASLKQVEIQVAQARSGGNPRILEHLVAGKRGLLESSETHKVIELDDVLEERIQTALKAAKKQGYKENKIASFLAGLAVLPPPVPIEDFAMAQDMDASAISSFAVDLAPMLEKTRHGIWFRDEPTETLIRKKYRDNDEALRTVAENLFKQQAKSVYAARALPRLLQSRGDEKMLLELAFSDEFPSSITSTVGKQAIRYARLKAAIAHAAKKRNYNHLVRLLVEMSTIAASGERGLSYIISNPDLIVAFQDVDSTRRLFESRTSWQGTRHARLCIAHLLQGEPNEASRHAVHADQWIHHYYDQKDKNNRRPGPTALDIAAIPLCMIAQGRYRDAASYIKKWKNWFAYEVAQHVFNCILLSEFISSDGVLDGKKFVSALQDETASLTAAMSYAKLSKEDLKLSIKKLAKACQKENSVEVSGRMLTEEEPIHNGLLKTAAIALAFNLKTEALSICSAFIPPRPTLSTLMDRHANPYSRQQIFPFLFRNVLKATAENRNISAQEILPFELEKIWPTVDKTFDDGAFVTELKKKLESACTNKEATGSESESDKISIETKNEANNFLNERLPSYLKLLRPFSELLGSPCGEADKHFITLTKRWSEARNEKSNYRRPEIDTFFDIFGQRLLLFCLSVRTDLTLVACSEFFQELEKGIVWTATLIEIVQILTKKPAFHERAGILAKKAGAAIEKEDDVNHRSTLYTQLSRAILPASKDEAAKYFRTGLEQMDILGSGDYDFVNELIFFAGSINGNPLEEKDFHTFTNICELNIYESGKFDWFGFGRALSKVAGVAGMAKLSRWDDRNKVPLGYTIMPFLAALVEDGKMSPDLAVCLLRLCDPLETWGFDFADYTKQICEKAIEKQKEIAIELLQQFNSNHTSLPMSGSVEKLILVLKPILGETAPEIKRLKLLKTHSKQTIHDYNERQNYHPTNQDVFKHAADRRSEGEALVTKIVKETTPGNSEQLLRAIEAFQNMNSGYDFRKLFFNGLRDKLQYGERSNYLNTVADHHSLNFHWKLEELQNCKEKWNASSSSLDDVFARIGRLLLTKNADDLISHSHLSVAQLADISKVSGIEAGELTIHLIEHFASPDIHIPAAIWLGLASKICPKATVGEPQAALTNLLRGNAAKLSSNVVDGPWNTGLYPQEDQNEIAAATVWFKLGSPSAADRWRAAHAVKSFTKLDRWDIIALLISKFSLSDAGPFQAPELHFYYLHARLWLLIALARVAMDFPKQVSVHIKTFKFIALDKAFPHALIQYFATKIILLCEQKKCVRLTKFEKKSLAEVNKSLFPPMQKDKRTFTTDPWHRGRPGGTSEPTDTFSLDYEFRKYEVNSLCRIFAKDGWEIDDQITTWVRKFDKNTKSMYENEGRERPGRRDTWGMTPRFHIYGEYLGWHGLFLAAGDLLLRTPVLNEYGEDAWQEWLNRQFLTRKDGFWLSDGTDSPPIDTLVNLLENRSIGITGKKETILALAGFSSETIGDEIVVEGDWNSYDGIKVSISSALVDSGKGRRIAEKMSKLKPFSMWLPFYQKYENENEYIHNKIPNYEALTVEPSATARLDEFDPLGSAQAIIRPFFCDKIRQLFDLKPADPFNRKWTSGNRHCCFAEAWGSGTSDNEDRNPHGRRLKCTKSFLRKALKTMNKDLLILIKLQRYENRSYRTESKFYHTTAVVKISKNLSVMYYPGRINWSDKE